MVDDIKVELVKKAIDNKHPREKIQNNLRQAGWSEPEIKDSIAVATGNKPTSVTNSDIFVSQRNTKVNWAFVSAGLVLGIILVVLGLYFSYF